MEGGPNALILFVTPMGDTPCGVAMAFAPLVLLSLVNKGTPHIWLAPFPNTHMGICPELIKASASLTLHLNGFLKKLKENPT